MARGLLRRGMAASATDEQATDARQIEVLVEQQRRLMALLGTEDPAKLEHDLRNLLNEVKLLRKLAELEGEDA